MHVSSHNLPDPGAPDRPLVSVFCAVWHKQPDKLKLLRSHHDNLRRQTLPVEPCYIFDNGDTAPAWLDAPWHSFDKPLTVYEAWAAGAALSQTRYVMNLNMDDRLADDAVRALLGLARATGAALVGGEWSILFDEAHLDRPFAMADLYDSQFAPTWPPRPLDGLRLGSGTGERGTFGPATLWDLSQTGRPYPTHFGNGEPILSIGDAIFWQLIQAKGLRMARLPMIVGRYLSDPSAQAEFRPNADHAHLNAHGVSSASFGSEVLRHVAERQARDATRRVGMEGAGHRLGAT
jgi:hypothetical protein